MSMEKRVYRGFRDLKVYQLSFQLALEVFEISKTFPKEEKYDEVGRMLNSIINQPEKFCI